MAPSQAQWLARLDAEIGNLRAAVAVCLAQPDPEPGLRLAAALQRYWRTRGHHAEGIGVLRALLDAPAAQGVTLPRGRALLGASNLLEQTGGYATAAAYCQEALAIARAIGDQELVAQVLHHQAWVHQLQGRTDAALPLAESGLDLARRLGNHALTARLLAVRASVANAQAKPADAVRYAAESLRLVRQIGDGVQTGQMLCNLGYYELTAGNLDDARRHLGEALDIGRTHNFASAIIYEAFNLGLAEYMAGAPDTARNLFAESLDLAQRMGNRAYVAYGLLGLALTDRDGADLSWSARLHGSAAHTLADVGHTLEPLEAQLAEQDRERLRAAMGDEAFDADYAAGGGLDAAQVLAALDARVAVTPDQPCLADDEVQPLTTLTPRELDVLKLVAQGLSNPDIAELLVLSEHTVHRHLANILRKLGLPSRAAAAAWGVRAGLV
jgi:DNA-binding CsgD family transcriptional regulator